MSVIISSEVGRSPTFPATDWTLIFAAREVGEPAQRAKARLCELYWYPVYAFLRRAGWARTADDALELTHEFFLQRFYEKRDLDHPDENKGRFHHWMIQAVRHFVANRRKSAAAGVRDPRKLVWVDSLKAEERLALEPKTNLDPATLFEHDVAVAVLNSALTVLRGEYAARGETDWYEMAAGSLRGAYGEDRAELVERSGLRPGTVRTRLSRMRRRLQQLLKQELAPHASEQDVEAEFAWLREAIWARHFDPGALHTRAVRATETR